VTENKTKTDAPDYQFSKNSINNLPSPNSNHGSP